MYPGGTWIGGIDPFGDIMGTSAGPAEEEEIYLFNQAAHLGGVNSPLHSSINSTHAGPQTCSVTHSEGQCSVTQMFNILFYNVMYSSVLTCISKVNRLRSY